MPFTCADIIKIIFAVIFPPLGVFLERGCGADLLINVLLTILGFIPGMQSLSIPVSRTDLSTNSQVSSTRCTLYSSTSLGRPMQSSDPSDMSHPSQSMPTSLAVSDAVIAMSLLDPPKPEDEPAVGSDHRTRVDVDGTGTALLDRLIGERTEDHVDVVMEEVDGTHGVSSLVSPSLGDGMRPAEPHQQHFNGPLPTLEDILVQVAESQGGDKSKVLALFQTNTSAVAPLASSPTKPVVMTRAEDNGTSSNAAFQSAFEVDQASMDSQAKWEEEVDALFAGFPLLPVNNPVAYQPPAPLAPPIGYPLSHFVTTDGAGSLDSRPQSPANPEVNRIAAETKAAMITLSILNTNPAGSLPTQIPPIGTVPWVVLQEQIMTSPERVAPHPPRPSFGSGPYPGQATTHAKAPTPNRREPRPVDLPLFLPADPVLSPSGPSPRQLKPSITAEIGHAQSLDRILESSTFHENTQDATSLWSDYDHYANLTNDEIEGLCEGLLGYVSHDLNPQAQQPSISPSKKRKVDKPDAKFNHLVKKWKPHESDPNATLVPGTPLQKTLWDTLDAIPIRSSSKIVKGKYKDLRVASSSSGRPRKVSDWGLQSSIPEDEDWIQKLGKSKRTTHPGAPTRPKESSRLPRNPAPPIGLKPLSRDKHKKSSSTGSNLDHRLSRSKTGESSKMAFDRAGESRFRTRHEHQRMRRSEERASRHRHSSQSSTAPSSSRHKDIQAHLPIEVSHTRRLERRQGISDLRAKVKTEDDKQSRESTCATTRRPSADGRGGGSHNSSSHSQPLIRPLSSKPVFRVPGSTLHPDVQHGEPTASISGRLFANLSLNDDAEDHHHHRRPSSQASTSRRLDSERSATARRHSSRDMTGEWSGSGSQRARRGTLWLDETVPDDAMIVDPTHLD